MRYLVFCECAHGLDRHGTQGCDGDGMQCDCPHDQFSALESAIAQARSRAWESSPARATDQERDRAAND